MIEKKEMRAAYNDLELQPFEIIDRCNLNFYEGNVIKYILRHRKKGGRIDLEKAKDYIDEIIEREYNNVEERCDAVYNDMLRQYNSSGMLDVDPARLWREHLETL